MFRKVRAGGFERSDFNAVNAAFRRSVSQSTGSNLEYTGLRHLLFYLVDPLKSYCYW